MSVVKLATSYVAEAEKDGSKYEIEKKIYFIYLARKF